MLDLVVVGKLTKQIAKQLGVTVKTIEAHRSNITKKMQVGSVAQLVRLVTEHNLLHSTGKKPAPHRSTVGSTSERGRFGVIESLN